MAGVPALARVYLPAQAQVPDWQEAARAGCQPPPVRSPDAPRQEYFPRTLNKHWSTSQWLSKPQKYFHKGVFVSQDPAWTSGPVAEGAKTGAERVWAGLWDSPVEERICSQPFLPPGARIVGLSLAPADGPGDTV